MANKIVKDSGLAIFVKTVEVPESAKINDFVRQGAKHGLVGDTPRKGEDGKFYANVDTAALVRVSGVSGAFTNGAPVYATSTNTITGTAGENALVGYADRAKATGTGELWLQLVPTAQ